MLVAVRKASSLLPVADTGPVGGQAAVPPREYG